MKSEIPKYVTDQYGGTRAFKREKRQQVRMVLQALDDLQMACAFLPKEGIREVKTAQGQILLLKEKLSVKNWGR